MISKTVGIDLGTTNSVIAMMSENNEKLICYERNGCRTVPSVVAYEAKTNTTFVGSRAFAMRGTNKEPAVSIKRRMSDRQYTIVLDNRPFTAVEVSKEILEYLKNQMQEYLNKNPQYEDYIVDRAVITVPAYFHQDAIDATREAGSLAGLEVEMILQEPTSSAIFYCQNNNIQDGVFMVYDLGGGTFDVSIVRMVGGTADVLGIAGNNYLGGDDFDTLLASHLLEHLKSEGYALKMDIVNNENDKRRFTRLKLVAENIKKELSTKEEFYCDRTGIFQDNDGAEVNLAITVQREDFERMIQPSLQETFDQCDIALKEAEENHGVTLSDIDAVLLVGGSTHIPFVMESVGEKYCDPSQDQHTKQEKPLIDEPDMAVGFGAAMAAVKYGVKTISDPGPDNLCFYSADINSAVPVPGEPFASVEGVLKVTGIALPAGIKASVTKADGSFSRDFSLSKGENDYEGKFVFDNLPSGESSQMYSCIFSFCGEDILRTVFDARYNIDVVETILARNYSIEVTERFNVDGREYFNKKLQVLMSKGTVLPASADYLFRTINPKVAELRFFEEVTCIRTVRITFNKVLQPGQEIKMTITCDKNSKFSVVATIDGENTLIDFEPSPPPPPPTETEIKFLIAKGNEKAKDLLPGDADVLRRRMASLAADIRKALDEKEYMKATDRFEELSKLVERKEDTMVPSRAEFKNRINECLALNQTSENGSPNLSKRIDEINNEGDNSYNKGDQLKLTDLYTELCAIYERLKDHKEDDEDDEDDDRPPPQYMICAYINKMIIECIDACDRIRKEYDDGDETCAIPLRVPENNVNAVFKEDKQTAETRMYNCLAYKQEDGDSELIRIATESRNMLDKWQSCQTILEERGITLN